MLWEFDDNLKQRKIQLISSGYDAYILFCLQGLETNIADELNNNYEYLLATPLTKMAHRSRNGFKYDVQEVLLSSYIFLYVERNRDIRYIKSSRNFFRILNRKNDEGKLQGQDLDYANWVLDVEGFLAISEAIKLNGKVEITNGPLKHLKGFIKEYSKRNRNCRVEIEFVGQTINVWLPFDWVDTDTSEINKRLR